MIALNDTKMNDNFLIVSFLLNNAMIAIIDEAKINNNPTILKINSNNPLVFSA